jgi:hypothetical protein
MRALPNFARAAPMLAFALAATQPAFATDDSHRFSLRGSATLSRDPPSLVRDAFALRGYLTPNDAPSTAAIVQESGRFTVMGRLVALAQVCYNDTIFRDDFDGDGG